VPNIRNRPNIRQHFVAEYSFSAETRKSVFGRSLTFLLVASACCWCVWSSQIELVRAGNGLLLCKSNLVNKSGNPANADEICPQMAVCESNVCCGSVRPGALSNFTWTLLVFCGYLLKRQRFRFDCSCNLDAAGQIVEIYSIALYKWLSGKKLKSPCCNRCCGLQAIKYCANSPLARIDAQVPAWLAQMTDKQSLLPARAGRIN
jgi:hypothetical protein